MREREEGEERCDHETLSISMALSIRCRQSVWERDIQLDTMEENHT